MRFPSRWMQADLPRAAATAATAAMLLALAASGVGLSGCSTAPADPAANSATPSAQQTDALPSWRDGPAKQAIVKFVSDVTRQGSPTYVPPEQRVAAFDNDGTLWSEQPLYFQFFFLLDQVRAAAPQHPEWRNNPAFKALMANDLAR